MNAGKTKITIDTSALADGDSIASYLVDSAGALLTSTLISGKQSLDVNVAASTLPTGAATEATLSALNTKITTTANGTRVDVIASALPAGAATEATLASLLAELQSITFAEDSAHVSGDAGVMALAVRNDGGAVLAGTTGDYIPLTTDATGALRTTVSGTTVVNIEGDYAEDSAHVSGDVGLFSLSVRNDNQATTFTSATGDYAPFATDPKGALYTKSVNNGANLQQTMTVGTTAVALPAAALANRTNIFIQMLNAGTLFLGSATVTNTGAARGLQLGNGGFVSLEAGPSAAIFGIANAAGKEVAIWEFA